MFHLEIWQFLLVLYWPETGLGDLATGVDFGRGGLGLEGGVGPALGLVAVGPANKEMLGISLSQHSDIILTLVLKKKKFHNILLGSISFTSNFHLFMAQWFLYGFFL